jgi:hypothetical protein
MYSWNCPKCGGAPQTEEVSIKEDRPSDKEKLNAVDALERWFSEYESNYPDQPALTIREREMWLFGYNTAMKRTHEPSKSEGVI